MTQLVFPGDSLKDLREKLDSASNRLGANAAKELRQGTARIVNDATASAPRRSGELASSVGATFSGDGRSGVMSATVTPSARHAVFQEFGTSRHAAQPFLFPAVNRHEGDIFRAIADSLNDLI